MGWLDDLGKLARENAPKVSVQSAPKPQGSRPMPLPVIATLRNSNVNDPGEIATGYYIVADGRVELTDKDGVTLGKSACYRAGDNTAAIASVLLLRSQERTGFNRPLAYSPFSGI